MRARIAAFLSLLMAIACVLAVAFLVALVYHLSGAGWHRAIVIVFLIGGPALVGFALLTNNAEHTGATIFDHALIRVYPVPPDERMTLNPTGVFVIAGVVLAAIGVAVDALN
jgi:hypothetical protein